MLTLTLQNTSLAGGGRLKQPNGRESKTRMNERKRTTVFKTTVY